MEKFKQYRYIILIILVVIGFVFYWTKIRPVIVRSACSWTTETIPADAGITKEQADQNKKDYELCSGGQEFNSDLYNKFLSESGKSPISIQCWLFGKNSTERPPSPEKKEISAATKNEYDECLRHKGL